jgi:hypothetical protein
LIFVPLRFFRLLVLFEPEIVAFPSGPTDAPSRRESNSAVLLTLIVALVAFVLVVLLPDRVVELTFVLVAPLVVDRVLDLTVVLVVPLVLDRVLELVVVVVVPLVAVERVAEGGGRSSNDGGAAPR